MHEDVEAIEAVRNGDRDRYGELVVRYERMVYGIAWSQLGDADLCEEAAQETFIRAYRYLVALKDPERFAGWLARIARNVSTSILRKNIRELEKRERWLLEPVHSDEPCQVDGEELTLGGTLREMLAELPPLHRECLVLFYIEGKNIRDAASLLNISESAMKTRLHRARVELRGRMEDRLEESLTRLSPRRDFAAIVPLLPALPLASSFGASTSTAKVFVGFGFAASLGFMLVSSVLHGLVMAPMLGWYAKMETDNLAEGTGKAFRKGMVRRTFLLMGLVGAGAITFAQSTSLHFAPLLLFQVLAFFSLWGLWRAVWVLRVNRLPFTWGQILGNATFLCASILIGFCGAPVWTLFVLLLFLNIVYFETNKSKPSRHDYNLFLRQATDALGKPGAESTDGMRCTRAHLKSFARFLGERYLIMDYAITKSGIRLDLPPVVPTGWRFMGLSDSTSFVHLGSDGAATARLGRTDEKQLRKACSGVAVDGAQLEEKVADVTHGALRHFLAGESASAEALLQPEVDEKVFVRPIGETPGYLIQGVISIVGPILFLVFFASMGFPSPPVPVSQADASVALLAWANESQESADLERVFEAPEQPGPAFFGNADFSAYRDTVFKLLHAEADDNPIEALIRSALIARPLYHVLRQDTLTPEQLGTLGFTRDKASGAMGFVDKHVFANLYNFQRHDATSHKGGFYPRNVELLAYLFACLDELGCLEAFDTRQVPEWIARHQVSLEWDLPDSWPAVDSAKAAGLFDFGYCNLQDTRAALWILQLLGKLDAIDREACIEGILRFHRGKGKFRADRDSDTGIHVRGEAEDTYYALESLYILDALERIPDLARWKYTPVTGTREVNGRKEYGVPRSDAVARWAYQLRLQEIRGY